ncbi:MAG: transporter substrate-binding domain-containing protein [Silicimonas sp.]|nr:transporter substrate-binding domain-containing protein [Silicimonas sp.]NND41614.1 transporter substrate-binding domain-containing protein [Silicimonas sp.]
MSLEDDLSSLARDGVLRAAINTGNRALVQQDDCGLRGISPALAARLADEIGARLEPVIYDGAGKVFADAGSGAWDVGFLAVDAMRAKRIAFTVPYISIEATFAVRASSGITRIEDVDRDGVTVLTSAGSAYDMYLTETLQHATLERSGTPPESFAKFLGGRHDAVAGVRQSLEGAFGHDQNLRILPGVLTAVHQAMVLPDSDDPRIIWLNAFVKRAIREGFVDAHS